MILSEEEAIRYACRIQALVTRTFDDYTMPMDGFCKECPYHDAAFRNYGTSLRYIFDAVVEQIEARRLHPARPNAQGV